MRDTGSHKCFKLTLFTILMPPLTSVSKSFKFSFEGVNHRIFIEGRGFDFRSFKVGSSGEAILILDESQSDLYSFLDFEEPRVIYVVSRKGSEDLILQGCRVEEIVGNDCKISFTRYQSA